MRNTEDELLTVGQVADELHIGVRAVQHRIAAGRIEAEKFGTGKTSPYGVRRSEVERVKAVAARAG